MESSLRIEAIWEAQASHLYFFILKRVHDVTIAQDVVQNTFLKAHGSLGTVHKPVKIKAWLFQIARNELANYYRDPNTNISNTELAPIADVSAKDDFCCFERFIEELPDKYQKVIKLVYLEGKTNSEAANTLNLSLANIKARIRRAKGILKQRFQDCCSYKTNESDQLVGEPDCAVCYAI